MAPSPGVLTVLVLGVGGNVSQSIQKSLAAASLPVRMVAACIDASSAGLYLADRAYLSPLARSAEFLPWLLDVCAREDVDAVLSGSEIVLEALAPDVETIQSQTGAVTIVSNPQVLATGRDKLETCRWLERCGLPVPAYAEVSDHDAVRLLVDEAGFPLVAKPRLGKGSDGVLILRDEEDLERLVVAEQLALREIVGGRISPEELLVQEYLGEPEDEFTAGCFCSSAGDVVATIVMRRRLDSGTTVAAELGAFPDVASAAARICTALGPLGPCNVQMRIREGTPVAFDLNPRFSGTTALRARMGFNEVEAALRHFVLGESVPVMRPPVTGIALRYWNELYVSAEAYDRLARERRLDSWDPPTLEDWGRSH